jgi:dihydrodipicolinate reductase
VVSFIHEAQDRTIFAKGAIEVAKWIVDKRPGFYVMADYIKGLKK